MYVQTLAFDIVFFALTATCRFRPTRHETLFMSHFITMRIPQLSISAFLFSVELLYSRRQLFRTTAAGAGILVERLVGEQALRIRVLRQRRCRQRDGTHTPFVTPQKLGIFPKCCMGHSELSRNFPRKQGNATLSSCIARTSPLVQTTAQ